MHASFIDTDMAALTDAPKEQPRIGRPSRPLDAVEEACEVEVLADERTRTVKELARDHEADLPAHPGVLDTLKGAQPGRLRSLPHGPRIWQTSGY